MTVGVMLRRSKGGSGEYVCATASSELRAGEWGKRDAVWPSSPIPRTSMSMLVGRMFA